MSIPKTEVNTLPPTVDNAFKRPIEITEIKTAAGTLQLASFENVWGVGNSTAEGFIQLILNSGVISPEFIEGGNILDLGSGTGIIGDYFFKIFKNVDVDLVDNNADAVANANYNVELNGFDPAKIRSFRSDGVSGLDETKKYRLWVGNLPMSPVIDLMGIMVHENNLGYKSNENGPMGRDLVDQAIAKAKEMLEVGGMLIFTASSRQLASRTGENLDKYFGRSNWQVLNSDQYGDGEDQDLKDQPGGYHYPYLEFWKTETMIWGEFEIYKRDINGNKILQLEKPGMTQTFFTPAGTEFLVKCEERRGKETKLFSIFMDGEWHPYKGGDFVIPDYDKKQPYKHRYYVYQAINTGTPALTTSEMMAIEG